MATRGLILAAALLGTLGVCWAVGTVLIYRREPVLTPDLPKSSSGRRIQVGSHSVRILERGSGSPLLLVAGTGGSVASWPESVVQRLSSHHHVVAVDLFGMGFSDRSADLSYSFALWSEELVSVLDVLGLQRASIVGHSVGGSVAIFMAANHPERVDRVILVGSAVSVPWWFLVVMTPGIGELFLASNDVFGPTISASHLEEAIAAYRIRGTRDALIRYVRHSPFEARKFFAAIESVHVPVLQLHGVNDTEVLIAAAERLHDRLQSSRLVPVQGAGHFVMVDAPNMFTTYVESFLDDPAVSTSLRD